MTSPLPSVPDPTRGWILRFEALHGHRTTLPVLYGELGSPEGVHHAVEATAADIEGHPVLPDAYIGFGDVSEAPKGAPNERLPVVDRGSLPAVWGDVGKEGAEEGGARGRDHGAEH